MKEGPDIVRIAALVGDPARANMLTALMAGRALTASELAQESGVTIQTASSHLARLQDACIVEVQKQGRHRYYTLGDADIAHLLETLMGIAARTGQKRVRAGPREPALRKARICYDHLAGDYGVQLFESLRSRRLIEGHDGALLLSEAGSGYCSGFGIDVSLLARSRRRMCRECLDWSVRRSHLAGSLGAAFLKRFYELGWARRKEGSRAVVFSRDGERRFTEEFPIR